MAFEIFLSHNHRDLAWCERVQQAAAVAGVTTYLAEHDQQAGADLATKVQEAIRRSQAVVVLISDNSVSASYVQQEIGFALAAEKIVIPLVQKGLDNPSLSMLTGAEYIPFDFNDPDEGLRLLNGNLTRLVERQRQRERQKDLDTTLLVVACAVLVLVAVTSTTQG